MARGDHPDIGSIGEFVSSVAVDDRPFQEFVESQLLEEARSLRSVGPRARLDGDRAW